MQITKYSQININPRVSFTSEMPISMQKGVDNIKRAIVFVETEAPERLLQNRIYTIFLMATALAMGISNLRNIK